MTSEKLAFDTQDTFIGVCINECFCLFFIFIIPHTDININNDPHDVSDLLDTMFSKTFHTFLIHRLNLVIFYS